MKQLKLEMLGDAIQACIPLSRGKSKLRSLMLLEELVLQESGLRSNVASILLAQLILENHSRIDSRVVCVDSGFERNYALLVRSAKSEYYLYDLRSGRMELADLPADSFLSGISIRNASLAFAKDRKISLFNASGTELIFQVSGRTPSENRFAKEAALIESAPDEALVPFEINFHPFWRRYGHTSLRIGESLYEFSSDGWRAHNTGHDSARAYLFNNPFFKSRYSVFSASGMPAVSYGVTIYDTAEKIRKLQSTLNYKCALEGRAREKFNLFFKNCNQKLRGMFREVGIKGFEEMGYLDFSSVLTFNQLVNDSSRGPKLFWLYPLPGIEITESLLRNWFPRVLFLENNARSEIRRAIRSVAKDIFVGVAALLSTATNKVFKFKLWNGLSDYQHINENW